MKLRSRFGMNNFPYLYLSDFSIISIQVWSMNSTCTIVRNLLINISDLRRRREIFHRCEFHEAQYTVERAYY